MSDFIKVAMQDAEAEFWGRLAEDRNLVQALRDALRIVIDAYEMAVPSSTTTATEEA